MKFPLDWARQFVDLPDDLHEISDRLTLIGYMTEHVDRVRPEWRREVGAVEAARQPSGFKNTDLITLRTGTTEPFEIRLLAPASFKLDGVVPLELRVGRVLEAQQQKGELFLISLDVGEAGTVRALRPKLNPALGSQLAVLCVGRGSGAAKLASEADVGYTTNSDEVVPLPDYYTTGSLLHKEMTDVVYDLEVRQNRPDCLGVLGLCRDLAAGMGLEFRPPPAPNPRPADLNVNEFATLAVEAPDLVRRFAIQIIRDVKIGPSPRWLADRVVSGGMRSINNVVDITNYVMLETGQPLHAFDLDRLDNSDIILRRARAGERIAAIDEQTYELDENMLVVANKNAALALAGVIGGKESEITEQTTNILLDAAHYNQVCIRKTSRKLGLRTEASNRLEKYLDVEGVMPAVQRATQMIIELGGGRCCPRPLDYYADKWAPATIDVTPRYIHDLIGVEYSTERIMECLGRLGFGVERVDAKLTVTVPSWRGDVTHEADVAEEVARIDGYEHIPVLMMSGETPFHVFEAIASFDETCRDIMVGLGLDEVITDTLVDPDVIDKLYAAAPEKEPKLIAMLNPPSKELRVMRPGLMYSLLRTAIINDRADRQRLGFFELGKVFDMVDGPEGRRERRLLGAVLAGEAQDRSVHHPECVYDVYHAKGIVESLLRALGIGGAQYAPVDHPLLHPGQSACVMREGETIGVFGRLHPRVREIMGMKTLDACLVELELERLDALAAPVEDYHNEYRHEAVLLDLNVVVDRATPAAELTDAVREAGGELLRSVRLIDLYEGEHVPAGRKSMTFSLRFQVPERTLKQEEVQPVMGQIEQALAERFGATRRV